MLTASVGVWLGATLAHFLLSSRLVASLDPDSAPSADTRLFAHVLTGIGLLSIALHVSAAAGGLTLARGLAALVVIDALALWLTRRAGLTRAARMPAFNTLEWLAAGVALGIILSWAAVASRSATVAGADAAHYHVPYAVNFALAGSLFDLPATQHLYPMAGSLFDAWFILPLHAPLVVDLSMCLPFLLLAVSLNAIFRHTTDLSGLAWSSWPVLALFSTPLFRQSALVSADLWFAASFAALVAVVLGAWRRHCWSRLDLLLGALAMGLLVGCKTTGLPAAALVAAVAGGAMVARRGRSSPTESAPLGLAWRVAVPVVAIASGGIWLIRNWVMFGSPMAPTGLTVMGHVVFAGEPWQTTDYLSVAGDLQRIPGYDLQRRADHFARLWLGRSWMTVLAPAVLIGVDMAAGFRRRPSDLYSARALLVALALVSTVMLTWTLMGAPWTSLEWTRGLSLRYVLPFIALIAIVAFIGLFPVGWKWYVHDGPALLVAVPVVAVFGLWFFRSTSPEVSRTAPVPALHLTWLVAGLGLAALVRWLAGAGTRTRWLAAATIVILAGAGWAPVIVANQEREQRAAERAEEGERAAWEQEKKATSPRRRVYLAALAAEAAADRSCRVRRFFSLVRFDEPLELQSPIYRNRVYYAGRDTALLPRALPLTTCDYVLTTDALASTDRGREAVRVLSGSQPLAELGRAEDLVLLGRK